MAKCKRCNAEIIWRTTSKNYKNMPCDPLPIPYWEEKGAKEKIINKHGDVVSCRLEGIEEEATGYGNIPHWATCGK